MRTLSPSMAKAAEQEAEHLARCLLQATDVLLERLFVHLSQLPEEQRLEDDEDPPASTIHPTTGGPPGTGGMTLPASAIGWLSSQLYPSTVPEGHVSPTVWCSATFRDRLRLLKFLLPRVTHLRISRDPWPPDSNDTSKRNQSTRQKTRSSISSQPTVIENPPPEELNCSGMSVSSGLTKDDPPSPEHFDETPQPTRLAFWHYMQGLQHYPTLDMRLFPRLQVLVLESVPPTWIHNLFALQSTLQVLKWNRSCLYNYLPKLLLPNQQPIANITIDGQVQDPLVHAATETTTNIASDATTTTASSTTVSATQSQSYPQLTHISLNHCSLGELSNLAKTLSRTAQHVQFVSLAHNDLVTQEAALKGLRLSSSLTKLNLSYNQLANLSNAHFYLGGQLQSLVLSYNQLNTTQGIDRLYALENLWMDHNQLQHLSDVAALSRLPQLKNLWLEGNPFSKEVPGYTQQVWNWFQHARQATVLEELPHLDGQAISADDWNQLMQQSTTSANVHFRHNPSTIVTPNDRDDVTPDAAVAAPPSGAFSTVLPVRHRSVQRKYTARRRAKIEPLPENGIQVHNTTSHPNSSNDHKRQRNRRQNSGQKLGTTSNGTNNIGQRISFSVADVLLSLHEEMLLSGQDKNTTTLVKETKDKRQVEGTIEKSSAATPASGATNSSSEHMTIGESQQLTVSPNGVDSMPSGGPSTDLMGGLTDTAEKRDDEHFHESLPEEQHSAPDLLDECKESVDETLPLQNSKVDETPLTERDITSTPLVANGGKKVTTIQLHKLDIFYADWDDVVRQAASGMIPDGKPRLPEPILTMGQSTTAFSPKVANLLSPAAVADSGLLIPESQIPSSTNETSSGVDDERSLTSVGFRSSALPEQIYPDDFSVPSSLGTNRDDFPSRASKFQIAEENAAYDGPERCRKSNVLENLELYFSTYVFPSHDIAASQDTDETVDDEDYEDWHMVALRYPRIQLWPEDRPRLQSIAPSSRVPPVATPDIGEWTSTRERFVRVWEEDVIPCGKPALRRLYPNRRARLGFHGDHLYSGGVPDAYAECRKVFMCLSSAALYIICRSDNVTKKHDEKGIKKRFPNPIPEGSIFDDAPWPHAVARHSFQELEAITIGFEFQRLTLRFSNPTTRKADPYVYVLLTCNKTETVNLLQEIQRLAKETNRDAIDLVSDGAGVTIDNDSQLVFDALQSAVAPELVGTILHYQIVQQRWRHGEDRGTVRRACIVTDTKLFLVDEDYDLDGHKPLDATTPGATTKLTLGHISYTVVDQATLPQVAEVQAAGADPKAITIVINPLSRLSRTHRWRLVCRDSVGAERLVENVRKAMSMSET